MKTPKDIFQENTLTINDVILNNQDKTLEQIANILNTMSFKTKKGLNWTKNSVYHYSINTLGLQQRNIIKANIESPLGITIDKLEYSNSSLNKEEHITRFNKNILNQLDKIEPKVTPELELEKEVLPNYEIKDLVFEKEGKFFTDSLMIASTFERKHFNILELIKNLDCSKEFRDLNFQVSSYTNLQNKEFIKFVLTRDGFSMIAMGLTGSKAVQFKEMYINQFNQMEKALKEQYSKPIQRELSTMELMALTLKGFQEQDEKILFQVKKESESIKHETNQVLEKQKIEFDKQIKEIKDNLVNIPTQERKTVYTQPAFNFESKGLKDTNTTFKTTGDYLFDVKKDINKAIEDYRLIKAKEKQETLTEVYNYMIADNTLPKDFYDQRNTFNSNKKAGSYSISMIDFVFKLGKEKEMQKAIQTLKSQYNY